MALARDGPFISWKKTHTPNGKGSLSQNACSSANCIICVYKRGSLSCFLFHVIFWCHSTPFPIKSPKTFVIQQCGMACPHPIRTFWGNGYFEIVKGPERSKVDLWLSHFLWAYYILSSCLGLCLPGSSVSYPILSFPSLPFFFVFFFIFLWDLPFPFLSFIFAAITSQP